MIRASKNIIKTILEINSSSFLFYFVAIVVFFIIKKYYPDLFESFKIQFDSILIFVAISGVLKILYHLKSIVGVFLNFEHKLELFRNRQYSKEKLTKASLDIKFDFGLQSIKKNLKKMYDGVFWDKQTRTASLRNKFSNNLIKRFIMVAIYKLDSSLFIVFVSMARLVVEIIYGISDLLNKFYRRCVCILKTAVGLFYRMAIVIILNVVIFFNRIVGLIQRRWVRERGIIELFPIIMQYIFSIMLIWYVLVIFIEQYVKRVNMNINSSSILPVVVVLGLVWFILADRDHKDNYRSVECGIVFKIATSILAGIMIYRYTIAVYWIQIIVSIMGTILIFSILCSLSYEKDF